MELNKLKKFTKESPLTFWIEFFKNPYSEECKELYKFVPELKEANDIFEAAKADPEKRRLIQEREDAIRNYNNAISVALEQGIEQGRAEERAKAEKELAEAETKAYAEKIEMIKGMLSDGLSVDVISRYSGLSISKIEAIKNS